MKLTEITFELRRSVVVLYCAMALALSLALLLLSLRRGSGELALWLVPYLGLALLAMRRPEASPLVAGFLAFLLGFARTYRGGSNLDLGLSLIALTLGLQGWARARRGNGAFTIDLAGLSLLSIAAWSIISLAFTVSRIRSFAPAPGFAYHTYPFNAVGFSSDEAIVRAIIGATIAFTWWGLYEYARSAHLDERALNVAVFGGLVINAAALVVQRYYDPHFLLPAGLDPIGRLNGVTSFCYALGDVALALFLLLPAWGSRRGIYGGLTAVSLLLLAHAVFASGSRAALLTMLATVVLWAALRAVRLARAGRRRAALASLAAIAALLGVAGTAYVVTPADPTSPVGRLKDGIEREGVVGHLVATRLGSYPLIFRVMTEYPLSGVGAGLYPVEVGKQRALLTPESEISDPYLRTSYAPNQFLNTGVEMGVPAMIALLVAFVSAAATSLLHPRPDSADRLVSLLALAAALQFGPELYNSEALVFFWLIVGLAAQRDSDVAAQPNARTIGARVSLVLVAGAVVIGIAGHLSTLSSLAVDRQWQRLRWRLTIGMLPPEPGGQWTGPEATFVVDTRAPEVVVRWHAGDQAAPDYRAEVSFYVDGVLSERTLTSSGHVRESVLRLPSAAGFKRISVRVLPPFVPAAALGGSDRRRLGVFIHSVTPAG